MVDATLLELRAMGCDGPEDRTLIQAGQKSFQRRPGRPTPRLDDSGRPSVNFHGGRRSDATHQSTTDPQVRLYARAAGQGQAVLSRVTF